MSRQFREITYTAPLATPMETDAYLAPSQGEWRLIVFPGTPCRKGLFKRFLRTAPRNIEVVVISRPGFGRGHRKVVTDWNEQLKAIEPFLAEKKIVVMGVSYGGELALKAALTFREQVKAVVTVAALIDEPHAYAKQMADLGAAPIVRDIIPNRWQRVRDEVEGRRSQIGLLLEDLDTLTVPIEVVHGDFDSVVGQSNAATLMKRLGDKGALEIIQCGTHYLELQYPRRLHAAVGRAIERSENR